MLREQYVNGILGELHINRVNAVINHGFFGIVSFDGTCVSN